MVLGLQTGRLSTHRYVTAVHTEYGVYISKYCYYDYYYYFEGIDRFSL